MNAVGRAAGHMVEEVRRQFREIPGILAGKATPDYGRCVEISTKGAQHEMVVPSVLAIIAPVLTGFIFGVSGASSSRSSWQMPAARGITRRNISKKATTAARAARRTRRLSLAIPSATPSRILPARASIS